MAVGWVSVAAGLALAGCAALVLAARADRRLYQLLAVVLLLRAGVILANGHVAGAPDAAQAVGFARTGLWYALPLPLVTLALALQLHRRALDRLLLGVAAAATALLLVAHAVAPDLFITGVSGAGAARYGAVSGDTLSAFAAFASVVDAFFVWRAARAAATDTGDAERRRAGALGLAFAIFPAYGAASFAVLVWTRSLDAANAMFFLRALASLAAGGVIVATLPRLLSPFASVARLRVAAVGVGVAVLGIVDATTARGVLVVAGYEGGLLLLRALFVATTAVAALRYGLADAGTAARRRVGSSARVILATSAASALAALAVILLGQNALGVASGASLALVAAVASWRPLRAPADALARALLLPPDDPSAVAERARTYAAAVAASRGAGAEGERYLARLRDDLGVSEREHALLSQGIASREEERYRSVMVLGEGASGTVDLATDAEGRRVVVKRLRHLSDPAAALREARAMAAVEHPRVVRFLEVDRREDGLRLVLEHAEGGSARELLEREGPLPPSRAVALTIDLLDGLDALHAAGVVHCDIKPENLLLDAEGRAKVGDFGSAAFAQHDATMANEGSLSTMSPEALRGATPAPARDLYAAGATLYRLLTGQHHVDLGDVSAFEARERITLDPPRLPHARVPAALEPVLRKALAKQPAERYGSAREMLAALRAAAGSDDVAAGDMAGAREPRP